MTNPRTPRSEPATSRSSSAGPNQASGSARTAGTIALLALVVAIGAIGLVAWRIVGPGDPGCQEAAWDVSPADGDLPDGWTVSATQYDLNRKTLSFLGPLPLDEVSGQAVVYATVTCFEQGAADAVARSSAAAEAAGQSVIDRDDLGDQGFSAADDTGSVFQQFRHGDIVVYLAASGDASATEVDEVASAFDKALGGDGGSITPPEEIPTDSSESFAPDESFAAESPAAPDLVAALPTQVGSVTLAADSASGSTILGEDQGSRGILAALRAAGRQPDDMLVAQAYDELGESDLAILGVSVDGMPVAAIKDLVLGSWLAASGEGVTRDTVTLAGKPWTRIDYGDGGTLDYLLAEGDTVFVITTADPDLAAQAAAALP